jgi:hypothetical protein
MTKGRKRSRLRRSVGVNTQSGKDDYRVGPGRPPKEHQFKPGQSGNPQGAKRKKPTIAADLKATLERALRAKVTLWQGQKQRIATKVEAGIEQLVNAFAKGDRYARRDLIDLCGKLGVDLLADQNFAGDDALEAVVSAQDQALLDDYVIRRGGTSEPHDGNPDVGNQERSSARKATP